LYWSGLFYPDRGWRSTISLLLLRRSPRRATFSSLFIQIMPLLCHITLPVRQLAPSITFYDAVMSAVGAIRTQSSAYASAYSHPSSKRPFLWLTPNDARPGAVSSRWSLQADSAEIVRQFHQVAVDAGGISVQSPASMPHYGPAAFGCVIHDLDGHQIELVSYGESGESPAGAERPLNEMLDGEAPDYPDY